MNKDPGMSNDVKSGAKGMREAEKGLPEGKSMPHTPGGVAANMGEAVSYLDKAGKDAHHMVHKGNVK